ncbi:hypothetical protein NXW60_10775 [Bacteroides fragilis]|nr:hypothetical protein NXW60_10775 [Bacteroides fragilis]
MANELEKNIEKSLKKLELVNLWISNCDTKASLILAFLGIIVTIIFTSNIGGEMINTIEYKAVWQVNCLSLKLFFRLFSSVIFCASTAFSFVQLGMTLYGRVNPNKYNQTGVKMQSNLFWKTIQNKKFIDFESQSNSEPDNSYPNDINSQVFINSKIAQAKFRHYNLSLLSTGVALISFFIFVFLNNL